MKNKQIHMHTCALYQTLVLRERERDRERFQNWSGSFDTTGPSTTAATRYIQEAKIMLINHVTRDEGRTIDYA